MSARIATQPTCESAPAGYTLVIGGHYPACNTIYVIPRYYSDGKALAWVSRWDGEKHHSSAYLTQSMAERVVSHALSGLDFSR